MGEKNKRLPWCRWMGVLEYFKPTHKLLESIFLHVQVPMYDVVMPMEVGKDSKPSQKISKKLEPKP
jgi:hypothetical protein